MIRAYPLYLPPNVDFDKLRQEGLDMIALDVIYQGSRVIKTIFIKITDDVVILDLKDLME